MLVNGRFPNAASGTHGECSKIPESVVINAPAGSALSWSNVIRTILMTRSLRRYLRPFPHTDDARANAVQYQLAALPTRGRIARCDRGNAAAHGSVPGGPATGNACRWTTFSALRCLLRKVRRTRRASK